LCQVGDAAGDEEGVVCMASGSCLPASAGNY